jgi:uncharacterized protein
MKKHQLCHWLKKIVRGLLGILVFVVVVVVYAVYVEPNWFEVKAVSLQLPHLSPAFDGYKIVQISDLHSDRYFKLENLPTIAQKINEQQPDLVVLTGDYVSKGHIEEAVGAIAKSFQNIQATDGVLAVLGNHDYWTDAAAISQELTRYQIKLLKNQVVTMNRGTAQLAIAGIDDLWSGQPDLDGLLRALGDRQGAILLAHEPDFADVAAATKKFDLQLSGHSHGNQVRLPFAEVVLPKFARKYPHGQYQVAEMVQYTNRGIGMVGLPLRFNCRPEITSFTLHSSGQS